MHIISCFKCKVYGNALNMVFFGGHAYCEKDAPEGSEEIKGVVEVEGEEV